MHRGAGWGLVCWGPMAGLRACPGGFMPWPDAAAHAVCWHLFHTRMRGKQLQRPGLSLRKNVRKR